MKWLRRKVRRWLRTGGQRQRSGGSHDPIVLPQRHDDTRLPPRP